MKKFTQNVNKDKLFNDLPNVKVDMSRWLSRFANYQSCNLGQIVPIYWDEVLPNEKRSIKMAMTSHTVTPVAPIFNSLYTELRAFVVPLRLCADLLNGYSTRKSPFVKVFGEDNADNNSNIVVPLTDQKLPDFPSNGYFIGDIYNYLSGAPANNVFDSLDLSEVSPTTTSLTKNNYLQLAAYELIYQRHYRNENYESATYSPLYRLLYNGYSASKSTVNFPSGFSFEFANREKDYFTGMKPFTQKGSAPVVNVGGLAPVVGIDGNGDKKFESFDMTGSGSGSNSIVRFKGNAGTNLGMAEISGQGQTSTLFSNSTSGVTAAKLYADLSTAQGITIEELRILIKTQELLEKDAMYGSLYAESLNAHFGCCPLDLTLQDPQELYKTTISSNMQAIFQTSSTSGEASILGTIGANSTTQTDLFTILPETHFKEHCIIMICAVHKLQNVYDTRYFKPKFNFKQGRFDFYTPELDSLGYQPVTENECRSISGTAGYNEAFAEYRFKFNKSHGVFNTTMPYWAPAIANEYSSASTLYKEGVGILDKALSVTSASSPQFFDAWGFEEDCVKPMSLHSIPGFDGVI